MLKKIIALVFVTFIVPSFCLAANYYVKDCSGTNGDGSVQTCGNPTGAWDGEANINWGSVSGTNTLYVCGTIPGQFDIAASGTNAANRLTVDGNCPGDAGIISGGSSGVNINNYDYINVQNLEITGGTDGIRTGGTTTYITFSNLNIHGITDDGADFYNYTTAANNIILEDSTLDGSSGSDVQCHGILISAGAGVIIRRNEITAFGTGCSDNGKSHGIYPSSYGPGPDMHPANHIIEIYENYIHDNAAHGIRSGGSINAHHNWISTNGHISTKGSGISIYFEPGDIDTQDYTWLIWSNIIDNSYKNGIYGDGNYIAGGTKTVRILNNTFYNNATQNYDSTFYTQIYNNGTNIDVYEVKNNIMQATMANQYCISLDNIPGGTDIQNNIYYGGRASHHSTNGTQRTWATWQGYGYDNGGNSFDDVDPLLNNPGSDEFWVQTGSDAINGGDNTLGAAYDDGLENELALSNFPDSVTTVDRDDTNTIGWDIGAYEYGRQDIIKKIMNYFRRLRGDNGITQDNHPAHKGALAQVQEHLAQRP